MGRGVDRSDSLVNEASHADNRNVSKYAYVDEMALERMGITQYKTESGSNFIRIISPKFDGYKKVPYFGKEIHTHTKVGADERTFLCLKKMYDEPCPVCELYEEIKNKDAKDVRLKALRTSTRYLFFVVDVTDATTESKGLRWFDSPVGVNDNIIELSRDRRKGGVIDVSDPDNGRDIEFTKTGSGLKTTYKAFRLVENDPIPDEWLEDVPNDFDEVLKKPEYADVAAEVSGMPDEGDVQPTTNRRARRGSSDDAGEGRASRRPRTQEAEEVVDEDGDAEEAPAPSGRSRGRGREAGGVDDEVRSRVAEVMDEDD